MTAAITTSSISTRLLIGPLTTTYTVPPQCSKFALNERDPFAYAAQGCSSGNVVDTSSCWPPALGSAPSPPYYGWGFYSPGLICPSGYTSACTTALEENGSPPNTLTFSQEFSFQFPLIPGETAVGCCPTGFTCGGGPGGSSYQTCISTLTSGSYVGGVCLTSGDTLVDFHTVNIPVTNIVTWFTLTNANFTDAIFYAPMFQINWKGTDLSTSTPFTTSGPLPASTPALLTPTIPSSVMVPSPSRLSTEAITASSFSVITSSPSGLSIGLTVASPSVVPSSQSALSTGTIAIAALGAIIPVVTLAFIGLVLCWWFRRRRRHRVMAEPTESLSLPVTGGKNYLLHSELDAVPLWQELEAKRERQELEAERQRHELGAERQRHELEAERQRHELEAKRQFHELGTETTA